MRLPHWILVAATAANVAMSAYTWWENRSIVDRVNRACAEASVGWPPVTPSEVRAPVVLENRGAPPVYTFDAESRASRGTIVTTPAPKACKSAPLPMM